MPYTAMNPLHFTPFYLALPSFAAASACLASTSEVLAFLILDILLHESQLPMSHLALRTILPTLQTE
jgi:hypothetical protein